MALLPDRNITLDLSLLQTYDYYTGIVFEVVSANGQHVLAQGGRYDELLSSYHPEGKVTPGVGFSMNIQELHQVLQSRGGLPQGTRHSEYLVVAESAAATAHAFAQAAQLRNRDDSRVCVEVELMERSSEDIMAHAKEREISKIAWVNDQGSVRIDTLA